MLPIWWNHCPEWLLSFFSFTYSKHLFPLGNFRRHVECYSTAVSFHCVLKCDTSIIYNLMYSFCFVCIQLNLKHKYRCRYHGLLVMSFGLSIQQVQVSLVRSTAGHWPNGIFRSQAIQNDTFSTFVYLLVTLETVYTAQQEVNWHHITGILGIQQSSDNYSSFHSCHFSRQGAKLPYAPVMCHGLPI